MGLSLPIVQSVCGTLINTFIDLACAHTRETSAQAVGGADKNCGGVPQEQV